MKGKWTLRPENITVFNGDTQYEIDLPDGDAQIEYWFQADSWMQLYVLAGDKLIPLACGTSFEGREKIKDCKALLLKCEKKAFVACEVYHWPCKVKEEVDRTPVAIALPEPMRVDLAAMVSRLVGQQLRGEYDDTELEIEELIDDLPEDIDEEYGPGYSEMDEEYLARRARRLPSDVVEKEYKDVVETAEVRSERARRSKRDDPKSREDREEDEIDARRSKVSAARAHDTKRARNVPARGRKSAAREREEFYDGDDD